MRAVLWHCQVVPELQKPWKLSGEVFPSANGLMSKHLKRRIFLGWSCHQSLGFAEGSLAMWAFEHEPSLGTVFHSLLSRGHWPQKTSWIECSQCFFSSHHASLEKTLGENKNMINLFVSFDGTATVHRNLAPLVQGKWLYRCSCTSPGFLRSLLGLLFDWMFWISTDGLWL